MPRTPASAAATVTHGEPYRLNSIAKAAPPVEGGPSNWYRYEITQGGNTIVGHRSGGLKAVTSAVEDIVERLNERRGGKTGRVQLTPSRKKAAAR